MTTAFVFDSDVLTETDYDRLMGAMGLAEADAPFPDGLVLHIAGPTQAGGWRVIDVWESGDAAAAFYGSDRFGPVREQAAGREIDSEEWPLHRLDVRVAVRNRG